MKPSDLLAAGWLLLDVENVPVAVSPDRAKSVAFDPVERPFPNLGKALHDGMPVSEEEFDALIEADRLRGGCR